MNTPKKTFSTLIAGAAAWIAALPVAVAQIFNSDGGIEEGLETAGGISNIQTGDVRETVVRVLGQVLSFLALVAVIAVIIAGIYLIVGMGSDDSKERAKKIILYTIIGLVIILFSRVIVGLITVFLASNV